jgi:hypothetical protein
VFVRGPHECAPVVQKGQKTENGGDESEAPCARHPGQIVAGLLCTSNTNNPHFNRELCNVVFK